MLLSANYAERTMPLPHISNFCRTNNATLEPDSEVTRTTREVGAKRSRSKDEKDVTQICPVSCMKLGAMRVSLSAAVDFFLQMQHTFRNISFWAQGNILLALLDWSWDRLLAVVATYSRMSSTTLHHSVYGKGLHVCSAFKSKLM